MLIENSNDEVTTDILPVVNTMLNEAVFRPMLFSTTMVQALLNGTKTQTRRLVKPQPDDSDIIGNLVFNGCNQIKSKINIGDIIWVRETFQEKCYESKTDPNSWAALEYLSAGYYVYKSDGYELPKDSKAFGNWKPSTFMPKDACRLWLKVTNVRCERLQEISENDAISEGISFEDFKGKRFYYTFENKEHSTLSPCISYRSLWEKINGKNSWVENPWVFVYEFEVTTYGPYGFI